MKHNLGNRDNIWLQTYLKLVGIEVELQTIEQWDNYTAILCADYVWRLLKREEMNQDIPLPKRPRFLPEPSKTFNRRLSICLIKKN